MGALWDSKESCWEQSSGGSGFELHSVHGLVCNGVSATKVSLSQLLGAKKHPVDGSACSSADSYFPPEFNRCPYCNASLVQPMQDRSARWLPPYGPGNGLKMIPNPLAEDALRTAGVPFPLPARGGRLAFCVSRMGAAHRLLIAVNRVVGGVFIFNPESGSWAELAGRAGEDRLPSWSWAAATDEDETGLCIPTVAGPAWISVGWFDCSLKVDVAPGVSVGGAVSVGKFVLAPVLRGESFAVVCRTGAAVAWNDCAARSDPLVVHSHLRRSPSQEAACGVPVVDELRGIAYWPLRGGYVKVSVLPGGLPSWEFRPWETDQHPATALIELGSPIWRSGTQPGFWQLCEDQDASTRDGIVNKLIKFGGDEMSDSEIVECGQFMSTGQACFAWSDDYWTDIHQRNPRQEEQEELRFPLLQFGDKGLALIAKVQPWDGRDESLVFSDFVFNRASKDRVSLRFVIEGSDNPEVPLKIDGADDVTGQGASFFRGTLSALMEIACFLYDDWLHLYFPEEGKCYRWKIKGWGR